MTAPSVLTTAVRAAVPRSARNWMRDPVRTFQWGIDQARFALGRRERLELRPGWVLRAHPLAVRCAYAAQTVDPEQRAELDAFLGTCTPGMRLLDIGAHFGVFSLAALHYGGLASRVVAVDPSNTATKMIDLHARLNDCADRLRVVEACAGEAPGERGMLDTGVIGAGYFVAAEAGREFRDLSRVAVVSVDSLCARLRFRPTHLKIDVEGDELEVLRGAAAVLGGDAPPTVFLELHNDILRSRGQDPEAVLERLTRAGYACRDVVTGPIGAATLTRGVTRLVAVRTTTVESAA